MAKKLMLFGLGVAIACALAVLMGLAVEDAERRADCETLAGRMSRRC